MEAGEGAGRSPKILLLSAPTASSHLIFSLQKMTEQATPNEIQEQINAAEQQQQQPEEAAPTGTDTVAPPEAPAATSTSTSTSAPPRQSSRIQQQQQSNNNRDTNNNASTSNNHDNQANQVTIDQIVHHTFQAGDNMGALNDLANEFDKIARNKDRQGNHSPFNQLMNDRSDPLAHLIPGQHTLTLLYIL